MDSIKREFKLLELLKNDWIFFLFLAWAIYLHCDIVPDFGDDATFFSVALEDSSLGSYLQWRYATWTSRLLIEAVLVSVVNHVIVWKILDIFFLATLPLLICKIIDANVYGKYVCIVLMVLYPFADMKSAGWVATTTNYLWVLWCGLFVGVILAKIYREEKVTVAEYILSVPAILYGSNQEQMAAIIFMEFVMLFVLKGKEILEKHKVVIGYLALNLFSFLFIFTCPGNDVRAISETKTWFPQFVDLSFLDKVYLGCLNSFRILVVKDHLFYFIFFFILVALVARKSKSIVQIGIAAIPLLIKLGYTFLYKTKVFPKVRKLKEVDWFDKSCWIPIGYLIIIGICIIFCIWSLHRENGKLCIVYILMMGTGVATAVIMGFSPTIYASGKRTMMFLYFAMIMVAVGGAKVWLADENKK